MKNKNLSSQVIDDFKINKYVYATNQSLEELRAKIKFVIYQREIIDYQYNLIGVLRFDNTFTLIGRYFSIIYVGLERPFVAIKGKLIKKGEN